MKNVLCVLLGSLFSSVSFAEGYSLAIPVQDELVKESKGTVGGNHNLFQQVFNPPHTVYHDWHWQHVHPFFSILPLSEDSEVDEEDARLLKEAFQTAPVVANISFPQVAANAVDIVAYITLQHGVFNSVTMTSEDKWTRRFNVKVMKCDDQLFEGVQPQMTIEQQVASLSEVRFEEFLSCTLQFKVVGENTQINLKQTPLYVGAQLNDQWQSFSATLFGKNGLVINNVTLKYSPNESEPSKRQEALAALQNILQSLKDHGRILSSTRAKIGKKERKILLAQSLKKQKERILSNKEILNRNYPHLALIDKIAIQFQVKKTYEALHVLEKSFEEEGIEELNLDEIWVR